MEFAEVLRRRRMVRHFQDVPLDPDTVERILCSPPCVLLPPATARGTASSS